MFSIKDWSDELGAIGLFTKSGRYGGGIYAHIDIAFEFASWISPEFKLYIIMDYQRLKSDENSRLSLNWNLNREIAKLNYRIQTDSIKDHLIPPELTPEQISYKYANEADMLNVVLFGKTAKQWREENPGKKGNIRDEAGLHAFTMSPTKWIAGVNMIYKINELIKPEDISSLREAVGWNRMDRELCNPLLTSYCHIAVYEGNELIGYIDSISNGVTDAYIQDLMVHPKYQGKGIGTELMNRMIDYMKEKHIYIVSVIFEEKLKGFYERFGFYTMLSGQLETYESR